MQLSSKVFTGPKLGELLFNFKRKLNDARASVLHVIVKFTVKSHVLLPKFWVDKKFSTKLQMIFQVFLRPLNVGHR